MSASVSKLTQGIPVTELIVGGAGLVATTMIPGLIVKTTTTTTQKWLKVGASLAIAIASGYLVKMVMPSKPGYAKAVLYGGVSGTVVQAINVFTGNKIAGRGTGNIARRIGETIPVTPGNQRSDETVQLIRP